MNSSRYESVAYQSDDCLLSVYHSLSAHDHGIIVKYEKPIISDKRKILHLKQEHLFFIQIFSENINSE